MAEMMERVARAIAERSSDYEGDVLQWQPYLDDARAAIEAMREPTGAQLVAANDLLHDHPHETSLNVYRHMIDAALTSEPKP